MRMALSVGDQGRLPIAGQHRDVVALARIEKHLAGLDGCLVCRRVESASAIADVANRGHVLPEPGREPSGPDFAGSLSPVAALRHDRHVAGVEVGAKVRNDWFRLPPCSLCLLGSMKKVRSSSMIQR